MPEFIKDASGKWVGQIHTDSSGKKTYLDASGKLVGRIHDNRTFDKKGQFFGYGDQGKRLFDK